MIERPAIKLSASRPVAVGDLRPLLAQTDWANGRPDADIARVLAGSAVQVGAWEGDRLVAFARAVTDGRVCALVEDVVVDGEHRGAGLGSRLVERLLAELAEVVTVLVIADDRTAPFYARLGFGPHLYGCYSVRR